MQFAKVLRALRAKDCEGEVMNVLKEINLRMNGGWCPGQGALGECAAITEIHAEGSEDSYFRAHLYLHCAEGALTPQEVAGWFHQAGCRDVTISAVLHDPDNNILNGASIDDGVRPWDVTYRLPYQTIDPKKEEAAEKTLVAKGVVPERAAALELTCRDTDDPEYWAERLRGADKGDCERLLDAMFDHRMNMMMKGIPTPGADARCDEGLAIFQERFDEGYLPF